MGGRRRAVDGTADGRLLPRQGVLLTRLAPNMTYARPPCRARARVLALSVWCCAHLELTRGGERRELGAARLSEAVWQLDVAHSPPKVALGVCVGKGGADRAELLDPVGDIADRHLVGRRGRGQEEGLTMAGRVRGVRALRTRVTGRLFLDASAAEADEGTMPPMQNAHTRMLFQGPPPAVSPPNTTARAISGIVMS